MIKNYKNWLDEDEFERETLKKEYIEDKIEELTPSLLRKYMQLMRREHGKIPDITVEDVKDFLELTIEDVKEFLEWRQAEGYKKIIREERRRK